MLQPLIPEQIPTSGSSQVAHLLGVSLPSQQDKNHVAQQAILSWLVKQKRWDFEEGEVLSQAAQGTKQHLKGIQFGNHQVTTPPWTQIVPGCHKTCFKSL